MPKNPRSKKLKEKRHNPTGIKRVEVEEEPQTTKVPESLTRLNSNDAIDREQACLALATLCTNEEDLKILYSHNAPEKVAGCLCDQNPAVSIAACGALRNMVVTGGFEMSDNMVGLQQNVMVMIDAVPRNLRAKLESSHTSDDDDDQSGLWLMFATEFVSLLCHLLTHETTCQSFIRNKDHIALIKELFEKYEQTRTATAQLLLVITEDNSAQWLTAEHAHIAESASKFFDDAGSSPLLKAAAAGILFNLSPTLELVQKIAAPLCEFFNYNARKSLSTVVHQLRGSEATAENWEEGLTTWSRNTKAVINALELFTTIVTQVEENEDDMGDDDACSASGRYLLKNGLGAKVAASTVGMLLEDAESNEALAFVEEQEIGSVSCRDTLNTLEITLLVLLDNLFLASAPQLEGFGRVDAIWEVLRRLLGRRYEQFQNLSKTTTTTTSTMSEQDPTPSNLNSEYCQTKVQQLQSILGCMWSMQRSLAILKQTNGEDKTHKIHNVMFVLDDGEQQLLMELAKDEQENELQWLSLRVLIGAAVDTTNPERRTAYTSFFLQALRSNNAGVATEGVHGLIDMFSGDEFNHIYKEQNVHAALSELCTQSNLEQAMNQASLDDGVAQRLEEAVENLPAFLAYKKDELGL